jgi:hypothetical protein
MRLTGEGCKKSMDHPEAYLDFRTTLFHDQPPCNESLSANVELDLGLVFPESRETHTIRSYSAPRISRFLEVDI